MDTTQMILKRVLFLAVAFHTASSQCTSPVHLYAHHGTSETITTPNHPYNYPSSSDCQWLIQAESPSSTVGVVFSLINTESFFDKIRIYDSNTPGSNLLVTLFGSTSNRYFESTGEYLYIRFTSDSSVEKTGFSLQYFSLFPTTLGQRQPLPCYALSASHTITLTVSLSLQQTLSTFPDTYSGNDYCYWLVDVGTGNYLNISILITDDEYGTNPGGLTIYDGNSNSAAVLGTISDKSQTESGSVVLGTSQQYAFFVYHRRSVSLYRGFLLSFNRVGSPPAVVAPPTISPSVVNSTCGNELLSSENITNYVTSPNYPFDYNSHSSCVWTIRATNESMIIKLTLDAVDLESCCDFLYIYDGETADYTLITTVTGNQYNLSALSVYRSTGSAVRLHFVSDSRTQQTGFKVGFISIASEIPSCVNQSVTTVLTATYLPQTFQSHPEYSSAQHYNNSYEMLWLITKPEASDILSLKFTTFRLEYSMSCIYDNFTIYKGACLSSPLAKTLCGTSLSDSDNTYVYSTGKFLLVRFKTDYSVTDRGFDLTYVLVNSTSSEDTSSSGLPAYVRYTIAGVITAILLIGLLCMCVCCCRKLCPKTASLKMASKSERKRNLILTNTNKPKTIKIPRKKQTKPKYGNRVTIDDPKFPLAGPGINPVAPPFPLDLKNTTIDDNPSDNSNRLPPVKKNKDKKPKKGRLSSGSDRVKTQSDDSSISLFDPSCPINFSALPPPFDYKDPWQLAKN